MKNLKKNGIILGVLTIIILVFVLKDDFTSIINLLKNANMLWILVAFLLQIGMIFFESLAFDQIIKSYKKDHLFKKTFELSLITKFFNGITPFSTGGQPMQVYYLKKDGFRLTKATNIIMQNFILYQLALVTVGTVALCLNMYFDYFASTKLLKYLVTVGFIINSLVMVGLFIISFSKKFNKFIVNMALNILTKLKLVKNREEQEEKWMERCNDFHEGALYIKKNKLLCFKGFVYNVIALIMLYMIPFFVFKSLSNNVDMPLVSVSVASSYVAIIGSFVPVPGASGGIEFGFLQFFGNFVGGSLLSAGLLIWRTITYYLTMIVGALVLNLRREKKQ